MKISQLLETKPKWQHEKAKVRLKSVAGGDLTPEVLLQLAQSDPDLEVRQNSIHQITDPMALLGLCDIAEVSKVAANQWVAVVGSDLAHFERVNEQISDELLRNLVNNAEKLDVKCKAASLIDITHLESILFTANHTKVQQLSATRLCTPETTDESLLERIHKHYQGKDKNVARIIKGRLQQIKVKREHEQELAEELDRSLGVIEKLASSDFVDDFDRRFSMIKEKWQSLIQKNLMQNNPAIHFDELNVRFETARAQCEAKIDARVLVKAKRISDEADVINQLQQLTESLHLSADNVDTIPEVIKQARQAWPDNQNLTPFYALSGPLETLHEHYVSWRRIEKKLQSSGSYNISDQKVGDEKTSDEKLRDVPDEIARQLSQIHWPEEFPAPTAMDSAVKLIQTQSAQKTRSNADQKEKIENVEKQLGLLQVAIDEGHIKQANKILAGIQRSMEQSVAPQKLNNQLHGLTTKLSELRDWQKFATDPKREELCISMEKLAEDAGIDPPEKAQAIKELQTQWKRLGTSESRSAQRMWARFKKQGDLAYEPCALYFAEQRQIREKNLEQKNRICDSLDEFLLENNWEQPDWKKVNSIINKARGEWRQFDDIPGSQRKKTHKRFGLLIDKLIAKRKAEQKTNQENKIKLIEQARSFVAADIPIKQKVQEAKSLQSQWKSIGITDRRVDQKLWKKFRTECDSIFSLREQSANAEKQKTSEMLKRVKDTVQTFADFLESDAPIQKSHVHSFRKSLDEFSLSKDHTLLKESARLLKKASSLMKQQVHISSQQMLLELRRRSELCSQYETGEIDADALNAGWQGEVELDKQLLKKITERREGKINNTPEDAERLCIMLEILMGIDSPPESANARMAYQVERLNRELSQGLKETRSIAEQTRDIQVAWYCLPKTNLSNDLESRFERAEAKLGA